MSPQSADLELPETEDVWESASRIFENARDQLHSAEYLAETGALGIAISLLAVVTEETMKASMLAVSHLGLLPVLDILRESLLSSPLGEELELNSPEQYLHALLHTDQVRHDTGILPLFLFKLDPDYLLNSSDGTMPDAVGFRFAGSVIRTVQDKDFYIVCNWLRYLHEAKRMGQVIYQNRKWRSPDEVEFSDFERVHETVEELLEDIGTMLENWSKYKKNNEDLSLTLATELPRIREILSLTSQYILPEINSFHSAFHFLA